MTATKPLTIASPENLILPVAIRQPKEAYILQLPNELLLWIAKIAGCDSGFITAQKWYPFIETTYDNKCIKSISEVCHRFAQIAQPLLFSTINFNPLHEMIPPSESVLKLHRTLRERADLRQHCRALNIYVLENYSPGGQDFSQVAKDLVQWLGRTRVLSFHVGIDYYREFRDVDTSSTHDGNSLPRIQGILRHAVVWLKHVEHVAINNEDYDLSLSSIFQWLQFPMLKRLELSGVSGVGRPKEGEPWVESGIETYRTAPFTHFKISELWISRKNIPKLIQWPTVLTHFEWDNFSIWHSQSSEDLRAVSYAMLEAWLLTRKETLKHVKLGQLYEGVRTGCLFRAILFPKLEFLQVSGLHMYDDTWLPDHADVIGPSLEAFGLDFTTYETQWIEFGKEDTAWIMELAETATARNAALKTIRIEYSSSCFNTKLITKHSWRWMKVAKDKLWGLGIELVYNALSAGSDDWFRYLEAEENAAT
ncbi:hypothetical protein GQ44DRAFT_828449 [Phaeosphaeriaceae sp. PMI808]|nr:hypothetical protein GQ44DRAFT_828449 [Phaeosphaeriaceae sp. PMI808]